MRLRNKIAAVSIVAIVATAACVLALNNKYDVNDDGNVDVFDMNIVWENREGVAEYNEMYDVNDDGIVNESDIDAIWNNRT